MNFSHSLALQSLDIELYNYTYKVLQWFITVHVVALDFSVRRLYSPPQLYNKKAKTESQPRLGYVKLCDITNSHMQSQTHTLWNDYKYYSYNMQQFASSHNPLW